MNHNITNVNSIFEQPWWLEAVAPGQWEVIEIERGGKIVARLPYIKKKEYGFRILGMPAFTQTLGYWIDDTGAKNTKKYAREKDLIIELISKLPKKYSIDIMLDHNCDYLFPFYWGGFEIKMKYSYRLENISNIDILWAGLGENIKTDIKKASKLVSIEDNHSIDDLINLYDKTFMRQGRKTNHLDILRRIDEASKKYNARKLLCAVDEQRRVHAAAYFVYDDNCCYYLVGGGDPELRNSGAGSLLIWEGILYASKVSKTFDFEGSMIEPIERNFRAFGGVPTPYWHVTKLNIPIGILNYLKPKIKGLIGWN